MEVLNILKECALGKTSKGTMEEGGEAQQELVYLEAREAAFLCPVHLSSGAVEAGYHRLGGLNKKHKFSQS